MLADSMQIPNNKAVFLTILVFFILISGCTFSQNSNNVKYNIVDENGKPVVNALVNLSLSSPYSSSASGYTDVNGTIIFVLPGRSTYRLTIMNPNDGRNYTTLDRISSDTDEELTQPLISDKKAPSPTPILTPQSKNPTVCNPSSIEQGNLLVSAFRSVMVNPLFCKNM